jgi:hypothetical protein
VRTPVRTPALRGHKRSEASSKNRFEFTRASVHFRHAFDGASRRCQQLRFHVKFAITAI